MEGDTDTQGQYRPSAHFNPLPPHGGRHLVKLIRFWAENISIHSLRMEGDGAYGRSYRRRNISIHSLRMEGDFLTISIVSRCSPFQSTPSAWRETICNGIWCGFIVISIHSLRMEGDILQVVELTDYGYISIHSLRMEGDLATCWLRFVCSISIHSLRMEGDYNPAETPAHAYISIHSLRMEGDSPSMLPNHDNAHFNPLPPHGGRLEITVITHVTTTISIHSLRMEGDRDGNRITSQT